jgi:hypothetical protein
MVSGPDKVGTESPAAAPVASVDAALGAGSSDPVELTEPDELHAPATNANDTTHPATSFAMRRR